MCRGHKFRINPIALSRLHFLPPPRSYLVRHPSLPGRLETALRLSVVTFMHAMLTAVLHTIAFRCRPFQDYTSVKQEELRQFLLARLKIFYEEELDVPLVL